jgi:hypothetical protein
MLLWIRRLGPCAALLALVGGCGGGAPTFGEDEDDAASDADTDSDTDADGGPSFPEPCADLYDQDLLPTFEIEIAPAEWAALQSDCDALIKQYRPIVFHCGAEAVEAMVRLKGNWSWNCQKMQFVVSFNEADPDGRFHGLRKIVLDAPWYDPTLLHERLAFFFLERYGAPASCVNNARLLVNGEYYGVYANVERIDREYLERHFDDPSGNLYEAGVELKTNEDVGDATDSEEFWAAADLPTIDALVDLDQAVATWAGEAMLPDPDSYWAGVEINFYLYHHPARGFLFLPYDADISFAENIWPDAAYADPITYEHPGWLREPHLEIVLSDPLWCEQYVAALVEAREAYDVALLEDRLDAWAAQIAQAVADDPHKTFGQAEHDAALEALRLFFAKRAAFVDGWIDGPAASCPPTWPE